MTTTNLFNIIKYPIITDKTTKLLEDNQYWFAVQPKANKIDIKMAVEKIFKVQVQTINTLHCPIKKRRVGKFKGKKTHYKKAIVTLHKNNTIVLFPEN